MIEAELKARLTNPDAVRQALARLAAPERAVYRDSYFDTPAEDLAKEGREVRLRTIETGDTLRYLLTYKETAADVESGSKPEYETELASPSVVGRLLEVLGCVVAVELTKECENYRFTMDGRDFLATLVKVPELDGTFLEVETMADLDDVPQALAAVRGVLELVGVTEAELTTELYTDAVSSARRG